MLTEPDMSKLLDAIELSGVIDEMRIERHRTAVPGRTREEAVELVNEEDRMRPMDGVGHLIAWPRRTSDRS